MYQQTWKQLKYNALKNIYVYLAGGILANAFNKQYKHYF